MERREAMRTVDVRVLGEGGGDYHVDWPALGGASEGGVPRIGWASDADFHLVLSNATLRRLVDGELTLHQAIERGGAVCATRRAGRRLAIDDRGIDELQQILARRAADEHSPLASGRSNRS